MLDNTQILWLVVRVLLAIYIAVGFGIFLKFSGSGNEKSNNLLYAIYIIVLWPIFLITNNRHK